MVSEQVRHKLSCTSTEDSLRPIKAGNFGFRTKKNDTIHVAYYNIIWRVTSKLFRFRTKALISFVVLRLVFAYAQYWFSHDAAKYFMHQLFVSPAPVGPGNSRAFNFSIFIAPVKARPCGDRFVVKSLLKAPAPRRVTIKWNNIFELF